MKKTIFYYSGFIACLLLLTSCYKKPHVDPSQPSTPFSGLNLKEFIGIYEAQQLNFVNTSSLVISKVDDFQGSQLWVGAQWDGVNGARVKVDITEKANRDILVNIPQQKLNDSTLIEGTGTFYYYDNDFFLDINYNLSQGDQVNNFSLVAVKKVYNQAITINISVNCNCDCECNGEDCECTCDCDD